MTEFENLIELINTLKRDKRNLARMDEASIKQSIVLRILKELGWNPFDTKEVYPEYPVDNTLKVDYSLRYRSRNKVFIEVKRPSADLKRYQEQLLNYAFKHGVKLAILTNGLVWWFYLPLHEGSWEERRFYSIDILNQSSTLSARKLHELLAKENVISGKALQTAEEMYRDEYRKRTIRNAIRETWEKLIFDEDKALIQLIARSTEELTGLKPDEESISEFLKTLQKKFQESSIIKSRNTGKISFRKQQRLSIKRIRDYTGKTVRGFSFKGRNYEVSSWKDMLVTLVHILYDLHRKDFGKILTLRGRKRSYFSRNPQELRRPLRIRDSDIYMETNLSANQIVKISTELLKLFGYNEKELEIKI